MTLLDELTALMTELDAKHSYPYHLPRDLLNQFNRFRKAMQLVAATVDDRAGRAFLRKYEKGERGQQLNQLNPGTPVERSSLRLMREFCQDAHQLEYYLKRSWKRFEKLLR